MHVMAELSTNTVISRLPDLLHTEVDGEVVLMSVDTGRYYGLDEIGTNIWNCLEEPRKVSDLIDAMKNDYEDDSGTIEFDTLAFLNRMADEKLIESM